MGISATKVLVISLFLAMGMLLPGIIWQPKGSLEVWDIREGDFPYNGSSEEKTTFLLNYAILAPSIYNTQPWMFNVSGDRIQIYADESRWLKSTDSNKREMYISIGGALENLIIAADHFGYNYTVSYFPESDDAVARVSLQPDAIPSMDPRLFSAIASSEMNASLKANESLIEQRAMQQAISDIDIESIKALGIDRDMGIILSNDPETKKKFLNLTVAADRALYSDVEFKSELGQWLSRGAMGPTGVQAKIDQIKVAFLDSVPGQIRKDSETINNSLYLGFITSQENDVESQVRAGQAYERTRHLYNSAGLSLQPMNQALQSQETKSEVSGLITGTAGNNLTVLQAFCLGVALPKNELTTRRPLEEVLI